MTKIEAGCGCIVHEIWIDEFKREDWEIIYCPTHAAAPNMYETLEKIANGPVSMDKVELLIQMSGIKEMAQAAIALVTKESEG